MLLTKGQPSIPCTLLVSRLPSVPSLGLNGKFLVLIVAILRDARGRIWIAISGDCWVGRFGFIDSYDLSVFPEEQRPWYAKWNAYAVAERGMNTADTAEEFEKHAREMIQIIRQLQLGPWHRFLHLWGIRVMRRDFIMSARLEERFPQGKSRYFWLILEFFRGPWREPEHW
jgi:hypothetical protein